MSEQTLYAVPAELSGNLEAAGINYKELFVTTKLWISEYSYDDTLYGFEHSMRKLGLEHLDMYLMHWPILRDQ